MKTITQIGSSALQRLFGNFFYEEESYSGTFKVSKDVFNLETSPEIIIENGGDENSKFISRETKYLVWGIALGLRPVPSNASTILEAIRALAKANYDYTPSHLVKFQYTRSLLIGKRDTVVVYRLSKEQEDRIRLKSE